MILARPIHAHGGTEPDPDLVTAYNLAVEAALLGIRRAAAASSGVVSLEVPARPPDKNVSESLFERFTFELRTRRSQPDPPHPFLRGHSIVDRSRMPKT